ncbi:polo-like kinase 3 [Elasticomyces elasticus]|nr:polo-like kinase 3 [Elasticomyces elasticus]
MYDTDPDVFAVLIPTDEEDNARKAFGLEHNRKRFVQCRAPDVAVVPLLSSREPTPAAYSPGSEDSELNTDLAGLDHLVLRFSDGLIDPLHGIQLGTNDACCDVLLGVSRTRGVSARQGALKVDRELCIWYADSSRHGSAVGYDGQAINNIRPRDRWILAYKPGSKRKWDKIEIRTGRLKFEIAFPNHEKANDKYVQNLRTLYCRCIDAAPLVQALELVGSDLPPTEATSQAHTPTTTAVYIDDGHVKQGSFGEVRRAIKARDGKVYALKWFYPPALPDNKAGREVAQKWNRGIKVTEQGAKKRKRDDHAWVTWLEGVKLECKLMKDHPHANMMPVLDYQERSDCAFIVMPYYPLGSLADQDLSTIGEDCCVKILLQLLQCLHHLHGRGIIHRDLKLANILLDDDYNIVIGDLGLSKFAEDKLFRTFCGTLYTIAPEVFPSARASSSKYGSKADVWSAAVVIAQLYQRKRMPLPPDQSPYGRKGEREGQWHIWNKEWGQRLRHNLWSETDDYDQVIDLLLRMLQPDPQKRLSAEQCLQRGCYIRLFEKLEDGTYVVAARAIGGGQQSEAYEDAEPSLRQGKAKAISDPSWKTRAGSSASDQVTTLIANLPVQHASPIVLS